MSTIGDIHISDAERRRHIYLAGATGTGKSTLLYSLMRADLDAGRGFALIDPHGDLSASIADSGHVTYLDPLDTHAVGFNPLQSVPIIDRSLATASLVSAFKAIWSESWGPRMGYILAHAIRLLLDVPGATLLHLPKILADDRYRTQLLRHATDPFNKYYWLSEFSEYSERFKQEAIAPIQNKVGAFAMNPHLRAILGQKSTLNLDKIMNEGRVLVCNLSKRMGAEPSHLLGALLVTAFSQAAERRATLPESDRQDFTLYVDEFQNFATETFATILSESRKWRLNLCIANQFLGQLPDTLRQAVLGNVGTLVAFRVGAEDAPILARELGIENASALTDTANFEAWVKMVRENVPTTAMHITTAPADPPKGTLKAVINRTRSRYARPKEQVEKTIARIFTG